jgi:2-oxoisovalerate dehydrogenase E1 component alpha subunit
MEDAPRGRNLPPLKLHVPEPQFRPGDTVDYADFDRGAAGPVPAPMSPWRPRRSAIFPMH